MNILLLTGSINANLAAPVHTILMDSESRLNQYLSTIKKYIEYSDFDILIFCENTGSFFPVDQINDIALKSNKIFEFISFVSEIEMVSIYGKGYGDGACIEYAINNSKFLKNSTTCFFKVTGRLYISNINRIIKTSSKYENCFYRNVINNNGVQTAFFKTNVQFFKEKLITQYKNVNDSNGIFLENIYFNILKSQKIESFYTLPKIIGKSGSTGNNYIDEKEYLVFKIYFFFGLYSINSVYYRIRRCLAQIKARF